jgi:guanylate kinase
LEEDNKLKRKGQLFVVSAPSGTGKTTICREVLKMVPDLKLSISYTTRPPRPIEKDGKDYFFITDSKFREMVEQNAFAEWAQVHGHSYGTPKEALLSAVDSGQAILLNIDSQGAMQLKKSFSQAVFVYLLPPSFETLKARLTDRASDPAEVINKRLEKAAEEIRNYSAYSYLIVNDDLKKAVDDLRAIIQAERLKVHLVDHAWTARTFHL